MTWEFRSRSTSRWTLTTNWGLDTISFERGLVFSVRTQWVSLHKVSERGQHCNRICSCIAVNANCSVSCWIIDEAISACFSPLRRARCLFTFLNLPHIPTCSLWYEERCIFLKKPSRSDAPLHTACSEKTCIWSLYLDWQCKYSVSAHNRTAG